MNTTSETPETDNEAVPTQRAVVHAWLQDHGVNVGPGPGAPMLPSPFLGPLVDNRIQR